MRSTTLGGFSWLVAGSILFAATGKGKVSVGWVFGKAKAVVWLRLTVGNPGLAIFL